MEQKLKETLVKRIVDYLERCNDISLLDFIYKLLINEGIK